MDTPYSANTSLVQEKIAAMQSWWVDKLHILADFDRTLTKWFYEDNPISSIASFLYESWHMPDAYQKEWKALFDHYYPIEIDHTISNEEKKKAMETWRNEHLRLMIQYKLSKEDLAKVVARKELQLREYTEDFFNLLASYHVPTVIISASGIWYDTIWLFLEKRKIGTTYIDVISNAFVRDDNGYAIGRTDPVIHSMNKSETTIAQFPSVYAKVQDRTNVILLGDSLHDIEMIDGFTYETMLSIGFCHGDKKEVRDLFIQAYDVVIFDDGDMSYPIEILKTILQ